MNEDWRVIAQFNDYEVSNLHNVRHIRTKIMPRAVVDENLQMAVLLRRHGMYHCRAIRKLSRLAFPTT